ncbi:hypothetical protein CP985_02870 [Malaciobacter mytili LMG 24559]|uniref:Uncharacterized protein n=1 Tax=Malaciobacter mytili LMG 24559 TaxID=1032238 RepID=A0AAX2AIV9_9BACT|nr:hypothetical protein [Malaciobacter mytili]AXH14286.1 putative membrane protein [Malaciobacter mytili LMG 24559]RXK16510.1 hypothetical protein CP985_02870 [Malaciobacter mytili LMG 24559]
MFRQVKSAVFWYYLYKFRKRVVIIALLLIVALFANAIYSDVVEYLKLKDKLQYLEIALFSKWFIIIFNIVFSVYLILTLFKNNKKEEKTTIKKDNKKEKKVSNMEDKLSQREQEFLEKKNLKSKADYLLDR